jgi:hypothetical protein
VKYSLRAIETSLNQRYRKNPFSISVQPVLLKLKEPAPFVRHRLATAPGDAESLTDSN